MKIGFIGCGRRAAVFARELKKVTKGRVEYAALADSNLAFGERFKGIYCEKDTPLYEDYHEMLERHTDLDGVIISSPQDTHEDAALAALKSGAHILLEKPLATTPQACINILEAERRIGKRITLGFVLRYTPFYRKVKELVNMGLCGDILTGNAEEIVNPGVTRSMTSTWRRKQEHAGDMLLEKCCHDLDIITWLMGKLPISVNSYGNLKAFRKKDGAGPRCSSCRIASRCTYYVDISRDDPAYVRTTYDECVYDGGMETCDHQVVSLEYEDGALFNFTVTLGASMSLRTIRLIGTRGMLHGGPISNRIDAAVTMPCSEKCVTNTYDIIGNNGGHYGGDEALCRSFIAAVKGGNGMPVASVEDGLHSSMIAFAAERSRLEGRRVDLVRFYEEFGLKI